MYEVQYNEKHLLFLFFKFTHNTDKKLRLSASK